MNNSAYIPKKAILLADLHHFEYFDKVIIESIEQALYRLEIVVDDTVFYVNENPGKSLTRRSIVEIQSLLEGCVIHEMFLRHLSPYDEMIGHEVNEQSNALLVPLGNYYETVKRMKP